jgi:hypothetical protein
MEIKLIGNDQCHSCEIKLIRVHGQGEYNLRGSKETSLLSLLSKGKKESPLKTRMSKNVQI